MEPALRELADAVQGPAGGPQSPSPPPVADGETIKIASFNLCVFGTSKLGKPQAMDVLVDVVRRFDVVAIQEIRAQDQTVVPQFIEQINADGSRYDFVIGPRLGRTMSKEQYAFLFDATRIELVPNSAYTVPDPGDLMHRPPMVARFRVHSSSSEPAFSFTLINMHTDPDETDVELNALDDVYLAVQRNPSGEDDVILLGDLNVDEHHLGELGQVPNITWVVSGQNTNTRRSKSYDNIVFDRYRTAEYTGAWGVLDFRSEYQLTLDEALDVSDHFPVWAEFAVREQGAMADVAERPATPPR
jgi:endonuclease/exonuclease/phosphatase family metal-dependent hydrolase